MNLKSHGQDQIRANFGPISNIHSPSYHTGSQEGWGEDWTEDMSPAAPFCSTCSTSILGRIQIKGLHANGIKHVFIALNESQGEPNKSSKAKLLLLPPGGLWKWPGYLKAFGHEKMFQVYVDPLPNPILNNNQIYKQIYFQNELLVWHWTA